MSKKPTNWFLYMAAASANLMSFGSGIGYGWTNPCLAKLNGMEPQEYNPLPAPISLMEEAWITSLLSLGSAFGPILAGYCSHKIGRKKTLLGFSLATLTSNLILVFASTILEFYVARFLIGVACGCVFTVVPVYLAEISQANNRGHLSLFMGVMLTSGNLLIYGLGPYMSIRNLALVALIPAVLFLVIFGWFIPESPHYLVMNNDLTLAEISLGKLRQKSTKDIQKELQEIIRTLETTETVNSGGIRDLFRSHEALKALLITNGTFFMQHFSGIVGIMSYLQIIFSSTGSKSIRPETGVILVGVVQVIANIITSLLIDRLGRKFLLVASQLGIILSLTSLGAYFYLAEHHYDVEAIYWLPVFSVMIYITSFSFGVGPVPWTLMGEMFPNNIKSLATTITATICLSLGFCVALFYPGFSEFFGQAFTFWILAFGCGLTLVFVVVAVPETKGRSLQEIQNLLVRRK